MHIKDFFNTIQHRFRNAHVLDNGMVAADLLNHGDDCIGKFLYDLEQQHIKGIECYTGDKIYAWGESISDNNPMTKNFAEILSIVRGLLESKTLYETIDDDEAKNLIDSYSTSDDEILVPEVTSTADANKEYIVNINVTFSGVSKLATMDAALNEFRGRLKLPNNVQYKITNESVEIKHQ